MAGARTQGPGRPNSAGFSGLAAIIQQGGEDAANRTERMGARWGDRLSALGAMLQQSKQQKALASERKEERTYQRGRDAVSDSRWAQEFAATQADRARQAGNESTRLDLDKERFAFDVFDRTTDNQRLQMEAEEAAQAKAAELDEKTREGGRIALEKIAAAATARAQAAIDAGDESGAQEALRQSKRAADAMGQRVGLGSEPAPRASSGLGRGGMTDPSMLPNIQNRTVGGQVQPAASDAADLIKQIESERVRTTAAIESLPEKSEAQRQRKARAFRDQGRALSILRAQAVKMGEAEKAGKAREGAAQVSEAERAIDSDPRYQALLPGERDAAKAAMRATGPEKIETIRGGLDARVQQREADKPKDKTPASAAAKMAEIAQPNLKEGTTDASSAIGHRDRLERLAAQPEMLATGFLAAGERLQELALEAVGGTGAPILRTWLRLNPQASPVAKAEMARSIAAAEKRAASRQQGG